jgi:hypothetical protein
VTPPVGTEPLRKLGWSGMLLRSAAVSGWPGLEVTAFGAIDQQNLPNPDLESEIGLLRMDRLSSDVMLCLWPTVPAVVTIEEPHEGVAFGFEDPPNVQDEGDYLYLRSLDPASYGMPVAGKQINANDPKSPVINSYRQIAISAGGGLLSQISGLLPGNPTVQARDFAIEMIKTPERAVFAAQSLNPSAAPASPEPALSGTRGE